MPPSGDDHWHDMPGIAGCPGVPVRTALRALGAAALALASAAALAGYLLLG